MYLRATCSKAATIVALLLALSSIINTPVKSSSLSTTPSLAQQKKQTITTTTTAINETHQNVDSSSNSSTLVRQQQQQGDNSTSSINIKTTKQANIQTLDFTINNNNNTNTNCTAQCSADEFSDILQRILHDDNIIKRFKEIEAAAESSKTSANVSLSLGNNIRPICVRELIKLIKGLASNELEMKTMLEFASDSGASFSHLQALKSNSSNQDGSVRMQRLMLNTNSSSSANTNDFTGSRQTNVLQLSTSQSSLLSLNRAGCNDELERDITRSNPNSHASTNQYEAIQGDSSEKSRVLPKLVASVDHWINTLERFTLTREWTSLMRVFQGIETIMDMLVSTMDNKFRKITNESSNKSNSSNITITTTVSKVQPLANNKSLMIENLKENLPSEVLRLTTSLSNLFPWHVWPWNNIDLYGTIDTFLNHGIFAFSKTTVGPERRIDFLPDMLQTLFKSLKFESFPKKCGEWSRVICDRSSFHDRLVIPPISEETATVTANALRDREEKVNEMVKVSKNQLTQELTCIMFSSLSMQNFGGNEQDIINQLGEQMINNQASNSMSSSASASTTATNHLSWDKQVQKALKLYMLAREALTDEQWKSIYNLIDDLWSQQKISDRVIMVGRIIQLLTNCHMPKEMLESALWKDIYKYKNVLNQLLDIVIEELNRSSETGKLQISQLALGSKHLDEILFKFLNLLPRFLESLSQTIVDQLPELVNKFFNEKAAFFKVPCKGYSFSDIIPSLGKYKKEIIEMEQLICRQIHTKPNITMMQINNLTNDFLAMAFNFSNFGTNLAFPKLLTNLDNTPQQISQVISKTTKITSSSIDGRQQQQESSLSSSLQVQDSEIKNNNVTSIIDEMAANPRLAQIVAILQSSALDPPEVHAELPELDWVEAGTSVALLYESIQKLLSYEGVFTIFPEIGGFQEDMKNRIDIIQEIFKKFVKRDPIRLVAYALDAVMPIALRTFKPMDSFHAECITSFRDIFSEDIEGKATRQWQCVISSMNFGSWVLNNFMKTFNIMFRDILDQMTNESLIRSKYKTLESSTIQQQQQQLNNTCIFFDGSVSLMLDNLPQFIDLALETVLMASTNSDQQLTLYDIMCSSNYMLDPFNEKSIELKARMKDKMCHLFHKNSLANCADVLKLDQWTSTMRLLNSTWFESNAISINPSFRDITINVHEFLELFGQFKPSTMSDSLIARVLNVNSFWTNLLNRTMTIIDKYQEKRFEYALQTLTPIIYDNLPTSASNDASISESESSYLSDLKEVRETLITTIVGAKTILNYLDKLPNNTNGCLQSSTNQSILATNSTSNDFESRIQTLFDWADQYSMATAEVLLRTIANNITKFESIFILNEFSNTTFLSSSNFTYSGKTESMRRVWNRFCDSPVDKYLDFQNENYIIESSNITTTANLSTSINNNSSVIQANILNNDTIFIQMHEGKEKICKFDWQDLYNQLGADSSKILASFSEKQLTRIALTKWGQVLDVMFIESKITKQLPKFFYMDHWQQFRHKLPQISPLKDQPSNLVWIWKGFERIVNAIDNNSNQTSKSLIRILDQLNCGLDAVKGGLSWENIASIYQDKQDILAAYSTINNGFTLASIGVNTFLAHKKFQRFLDEFVKPKVGLNAFCEMRDRLQLESIFSIPEGQDYLNALESFQELICDTNFETLAQNINPISVCYQITSSSSSSLTSIQTFSNQQQQQSLSKVSPTSSSHPLADIMDRFFKLASLAILDAKLIVTSESKPPILDKNQWLNFWNWWSDKAEPQPKSSLALSVVRAFQTIDSINSNHVVWKALFRSVHEISEVIAYLLRAVEKKHQEVDMIGAASRLSLMKEAASQIDTAIRSNGNSKQSQQQQLASTLSNIMFPEVNNFISFRTFKQLRYIKSISEYFTQTKGAQESICKSLNNNQFSNDKQFGRKPQSSSSRIELIGYKLNTNEKLFSLLCHYHSSQWLTALNIVISTRTSSIPKKVNYMTKYLSIFTRSYKHNESLDNFIHSQQLENIENVANTTVSYLVATSHSLKSLSFSKISNISWHSLPNLLDSIDRHLCASKYEHGSFHIPIYEPKKPDLETLICKLPSWNMSQVYNYLSENFDLQNMISLLSQQNTTATVITLPVSTTTTTVLPTTESNTSNNVMINTTSNQTRTCITPFKFASRWLKIGQETVDEFMTKTSRDKIKKCLSSFKKGQSLYPQSVRYIKLVNSLLTYINDLTINNSWNIVKKAWNSISYLIINQNPSYVPKLY